MKLRNLLLAGLLCLLPFSLFANPIKGLLERIEAGASKKFIIQLQKNADTDFFELDQKGNKIVVRGNTELVLEILCRHPPFVEQHDGRTARFSPTRHQARTT